MKLYRAGGKWASRPILVRFWERVEKSDGCWLWVGYKDPRYGYGLLGSGGGKYSRPLFAHRISFEHHYGPIPLGKEIHHKCQNKICVNPAHLEAVTRREHNKKPGHIWAKAQAATHCPNGHLWSHAAAYRRDNGYRYCGECHRDRLRAKCPRS